MRCLVVADLHYSLPQFDWLVAAAPQFDLVVFAGDALDIGSIVDFRAQIVVVQKYLSMLAATTRVVVCSGNHDLDTRNAEGEKVPQWLEALRGHNIVCDGESFFHGDTLFTVCPWWDGPIVKQRIADQLEADAGRVARKRIWIHHAPPANSPVSWGGKRFFGDPDLVTWIERYQPDLVISGHVHQSPFVRDGSWFDRLGKTWAFNVGHQFGRPPAHMVLDLASDEAFWISAAGAERLDLAAPLQRPAPPITSAPDWLRSLGRIADPILAKPQPVPG
jgi:Icc-related predicted phosphoesterase